MELEVYNISGAKTGKKISVDEEIFGIEPHEHAMWLAIKATLANRRSGTHSTKGRSEVAGSTRKLFRQKGTGRARQGDIKSPLHPGGGTMHGPKPHKYVQTLPKKVKQLARKSALSQKVKADAFYIVEDFSWNEAKTKNMESLLKSLNLVGKQSLLLTTAHDENVYKSGRNIPTLTVVEADKASMYDIWKNRVLIVQQSAIPVIEQGFKGGKPQVEVEHIALNM
ncbi:MAG: 50S ribosomal protein L4 [Bacteroidota bacterium]|nr:50S ribosomal protein L4 [Bacteroidota bacterium]MDP4230650.1 50S ribosomal protein L4 [Bacteroidota bacterium]MDP4237533.1 50S ribosomal protein L4 [Bacteroidota bacterium]